MSESKTGQTEAAPADGRIRAKARDRLRAASSKDRFNSLVAQAEHFARTLKLFQSWPDPLTSRERLRLIRLLQNSKPLAERAFPFLQPSPIGKLLDLLQKKVAIEQGRRRDDDAIFARKMLAWGAQQIEKKHLDAQIRPLELFLLAVSVGLQPVPDLVESERARWEHYARARWEKLHQRNSPRSKAAPSKDGQKRSK